MHTFEPGLYGDEVAASKFGGATWFLEVVRYLKSKGHTVSFAFPHHSYFKGTKVLTEEQIAAITPNKMDVVTSKTEILNYDVALMYYRWEMTNRPERQYAFECQELMIRWFDDFQFPYIVFDGDHMISSTTANKICGSSGRIAAPEINPMRPYVRSLLYPNVQQSSDFFPYTEDRDNSVVYIGNDYGRRQLTMDFMNPLSERYDVKIFGNWGVTEEAYSANKKDMPNVKFMGPIRNDLVLEELKKASWTVHLMKPSYIDSGFCTYRWVEAVQAGLPAFIPSRFPFPYDRGILEADDFKMFFGYVSDGKEALTIPHHLRRNIYQNQKQFVDQFFLVEEWEDALWDCVRGKWL